MFKQLILKPFSPPVPPTTQPGPWPPDVDFCDLLYCDQVYCCTPPAGGGADSNITSTGPPEAEKSNLTGDSSSAQSNESKRFIFK